MSKAFLVFLLILFGIHLTIFLWLAVQYRKSYHILAAITFVLLLISTGVRLACPEVHLGPYPLFACIKYTAWLATAAAVISYLGHRYFK